MDGLSAGGLHQRGGVCREDRGVEAVVLLDGEAAVLVEPEGRPAQLDAVPERLVLGQAPVLLLAVEGPGGPPSDDDDEGVVLAAGLRLLDLRDRATVGGACQRVGDDEVATDELSLVLEDVEEVGAGRLGAGGRADAHGVLLL